MAAAPGALLSAVTDNRINEFVFKAVLHVLAYAYIELAAIVIERPGKTAWRRPPVGRHAFNCWE